MWCVTPPCFSVLALYRYRFREPSLFPFFNLEWSPEWESPDLMFHRTVLLFFGDFIIPHFLAIVNMASYQKYVFAFYAKGRNCVTSSNSPFTNAKKCDILNNGGSSDSCLIRLFVYQRILLTGKGADWRCGLLTRDKVNLVFAPIARKRSRKFIWLYLCESS